MNAAQLKHVCFLNYGVKVWNAITGQKIYTFEGHEAPVYSVCPHQKENIQVDTSQNQVSLITFKVVRGF